MRQFRGSNAAAIPDPKARDTALVHEDQLRELSNAVARLGRGETPDGAGSPLPVGVTDHGALTGLGDDDHSQYALLAGRSGGQTLFGGTGSSDALTLQGVNGGTSYHNSGTVVVGGNAVTAIAPTSTVSSGTGTTLLIDTKPTGLGEGRLIWCRNTTGAASDRLIVSNTYTQFYPNAVPNGMVTLDSIGTSFDTAMRVTSPLSTAKALILRGAASQSDNIQEWQDSAGTLLASVSNAGAGAFASVTSGGAAVYSVGGTDVAVADGGTGASTAAGARTNLGLGALATLSTVSAAEINNRTRSIWLSGLLAYDQNLGTLAVPAIDGTGVFSGTMHVGVDMPNATNTELVFHFTVPEDYVSSARWQFVFSSYGIAASNNIEVDMWYASVNPNAGSMSTANEGSVTGASGALSISATLATLSRTDFAVDTGISPGDIVRLHMRRAGATATDTYNDSVLFMGLKFVYLADS